MKPCAQHFPPMTGAWSQHSSRAVAASPCPRQQVPLTKSHLPAQQSLLSRHAVPGFVQQRSNPTSPPHAIAVVVSPVQHSPVDEQDCPLCVQHRPPVHAPEQQSSSRVQTWPPGVQQFW